jgi:UV DNA damage repair endonuclease
MDHNSYGLIGVSKILLEEDDSKSFLGLSKKDFDEKLKSGEDEDGNSRNDAYDALGEVIVHNFNLVKDIINHCGDCGIKHYRIPSSIFSLASVYDLNIPVEKLPNSEKILALIEEVGILSRSRSVSLSIMCDAFNHLNSEDEEVVQKSVEELNFYGWLFDEMNLPKNLTNPIVIKLLTQPDGDSISFSDRFFETFKGLKRSVRKRVVIQNELKGFWNCVNLFKYFHVYVYEQHGYVIPLSYSRQADLSNPSVIEDNSIDTAVNVGAFHETWQGVNPVFTWTELNAESVQKERLSGPIEDFGYPIKWECDVKGKDKAILELISPEEESRLSEEEVAKIVKKKYRSADDYYSGYKGYNALYNK